MVHDLIYRFGFCPKYSSLNERIPPTSSFSNTKTRLYESEIRTETQTKSSGS